MGRRRDDETRTYRDDDGERARPARKRRRAEKPSMVGAWLALAGLILVAGALVGGLWLRSRRAKPETPPVAGAPGQPGTPAPAAASADLDAAIAEADRLDPGWRWDQLWAKREAVPASENSARVVVEAHRLLPRGPQDAPNFIERAGESRLDEGQLGELNAWLKPRSAAVRAALPLANRPRGRYDIKVTPDFISTLLPDIQKARELVTVLRAEAARRAEAGDPNKLDEFRAMLNAARSIGDEPMIISQLVRMAASTIAVRSLEQTLLRTTPDEAALAAAQKVLADEAGFDALLVAWRGERAMQFGLLEAVDSGKVLLAQMQETFRGFGKDAAWPADAGPGSPALRSGRVWSLRSLTQLVEVAKKPLPEQPAALKALRPGQPPAFLAPLLDLQNQLSDGGIQGAYHRRAALLRAAVVAVAAERYRLKHGRWPLEAKEIDAALVGTPPADPYDGAALRLRRVDGGLVVYSIGANGRDDGGDLGDRGREAPDVGLRLWDAEKRR